MKEPLLTPPRPAGSNLQPVKEAGSQAEVFKDASLGMGKRQPSMTSEKPGPQPSHGRFRDSIDAVSRRKTTIIAVFALAAILLHLILRFVFHTSSRVYQIPLLATLAFGGIPLVYDLLKKLWRREFGFDLLAGISIVTSVLLGEYLVGSFVVLMLSGREAIENYAVRSASSVLRALAKRMPSVAHRKRDSAIIDVALDEVAVGDTLVVYPHDICPVDGTVGPLRRSGSRHRKRLRRRTILSGALPRAAVFVFHGNDPPPHRLASKIPGGAVAHRLPPKLATAQSSLIFSQPNYPAPARLSPPINPAVRTCANLVSNSYYPCSVHHKEW